MRHGTEDGREERFVPGLTRVEPVSAEARAGLPPEVVEQVDSMAESLRFVGGRPVLFAGPPGTGKTMAAQVLAAALGRELYRVDLAALTSKFIGETEKNLSCMFEAAANGGFILFFDEADGLFGKRGEVGDAHDRYANLKAGYLLERLENFAGLAILTSNSTADVDPAFVRRCRHVLEFPVPKPRRRRGLWQRLLAWPGRGRRTQGPG